MNNIPILLNLKKIVSIPKSDVQAQQRQYSYLSSSKSPSTPHQIGQYPSNYGNVRIYYKNKEFTASLFERNQEIIIPEAHFSGVDLPKIKEKSSSEIYKIFSELRPWLMPDSIGNFSLHWKCLGVGGMEENPNKPNPSLQSNSSKPTRKPPSPPTYKKISELVQIYDSFSESILRDILSEEGIWLSTLEFFLPSCRVPSCFISYAWGNQSHMEWVRNAFFPSLQCLLSKSILLNCEQTYENVKSKKILLKEIPREKMNISTSKNVRLDENINRNSDIGLFTDHVMNEDYVIFFASPEALNKYNKHRILSSSTDNDLFNLFSDSVDQQTLYKSLVSKLEDFDIVDPSSGYLNWRDDMKNFIYKLTDYFLPVGLNEKKDSIIKVLQEMCELYKKLYIPVLQSELKKLNARLNDPMRQSSTMIVLLQGTQKQSLPPSLQLLPAVSMSSDQFHKDEWEYVFKGNLHRLKELVEKQCIVSHNNIYTLEEGFKSYIDNIEKNSSNSSLKLRNDELLFFKELKKRCFPLFLMRLIENMGLPKFFVSEQLGINKDLILKKQIKYINNEIIKKSSDSLHSLPQCRAPQPPKPAEIPFKQACVPRQKTFIKNGKIVSMHNKENTIDYLVHLTT